MKYLNSILSFSIISRVTYYFELKEIDITDFNYSNAVPFIRGIKVKNKIKYLDKNIIFISYSAFRKRNKYDFYFLIF